MLVTATGKEASNKIPTTNSKIIIDIDYVDIFPCLGETNCVSKTFVCRKCIDIFPTNNILLDSCTDKLLIVKPVTASLLF